MVSYMRNKNGEKRIQAERPRVQGNPPALDRDPQRLIFGYCNTIVRYEPPTERAAREQGGGRAYHATV